MTIETSTEATQGDETQAVEIQDEKQTERDRIAENYEKNLLVESGKAEPEARPQTEQIEQPSSSNDVDQSEPETPQPQLIKVKIDGEEKEITIEELTRNYQKTTTADKRLQQAAEERKRLAEERQELLELRKQTAPQPQEPDRLTQLIQIRKEALKQGNVDLFEQADAEIANERLQQVSKQSIDADALTQRIYTELNTKLEYENAHSKFLESNKAIANNQMLYNLAMQQLNAVCQDETIETYEQAFKEVERQLQEITTAITPKTDIQTDRQALKSTIPNSTGRATARTAPPATVKEETPQDVIAEMRRARGQA